MPFHLANKLTPKDHIAAANYQTTLAGYSLYFIMGPDIRRILVRGVSAPLPPEAKKI